MKSHKFGHCLVSKMQVQNQLVRTGAEGLNLPVLVSSIMQA